jgi:hypothetical protein
MIMATDQRQQRSHDERAASSRANVVSPQSPPRQQERRGGGASSSNSSDVQPSRAQCCSSSSSTAAARAQGSNHAGGGGRRRRKGTNGGTAGGSRLPSEAAARQAAFVHRWPKLIFSDTTQGFHGSSSPVARSTGPSTTASQTINPTLFTTMITMGQHIERLNSALMTDAGALQTESHATGGITTPSRLHLEAHPVSEGLSQQQQVISHGRRVSTIRLLPILPSQGLHARRCRL